MTGKNIEEILGLLDDPEGVRVFVNGWDEVYLEKKDGFEHTGLKLDGPGEVAALVRGLGLKVGRDLSAAEKVVHFRLPDGKTVAAFRPPGSTNPLVCISR